MLEKIGRASKKASVIVMLALLGIALVFIVSSMILSPWA